jgi:hypothetical protein
MMKLRRLFFVLVCTLAALPLSAAEPNTLTAAEKSAGWKLLFDGKSFDGWRGYKTEAVGAGWKVQDGALTITVGRTGDLITVAEYGDFELSFEWRIAAGGNSGVLYRVGLGEAAVPRTGPEYQILDNAKAKDTKVMNHLAGSLYDLGPATPPHLPKPVGEWNSARIVIRGWKIEHWLNGTKVIAADLASPEGKAMVSGSKFKSWPKFATLSRGHIALQDHGDVVSYRSLKLRELD